MVDDRGDLDDIFYPEFEGNSGTKILAKSGEHAWIWRKTSSKQGF